MTATEVVLGLDLGTTSSKAVVQDLAERQVTLVEAPTSWTSVGTGTQTTAESLLRLAVDLLTRAVHAAQSRLGDIRVIGIGVTGLAESGVVLDAGGQPSAPVIAWFDPRGEREIALAGAREPLLPEQFARRTGLPWDSQSSLATLLWLQANGVTLTAAHRWSSVPEWIVHSLGGRLVREPSLASRTGLVDQATGEVWQEGVEAAGLPTTLLPPVAFGGHCVGRLSLAGMPAALQGAALTVAGHDHPVAAIGVGATGTDELFNSAGTADVVARSLPGVLDDHRRELLVRSGLSAGAHVLPGTTLVLGGARGGLLLRRVLAALGALGPGALDSLDQAALEVGELPPGLAVSGAGPTGDDVVLRLRDDVRPAVVWAAATRYTAAETAALLQTIESVVGPHHRAVASGGWTRMASVRAAKSAVISDLEFSPLAEPGVVGAARLAARAAGVTESPTVPPTSTIATTSTTATTDLHHISTRP